MKAEQFIVDEVTKHLKVMREKEQNTKILTQCKRCRRFEGFILPYYVFLQMEGTQYPVNVEELYIYCDNWEEFYNETVINVTQEILEAEQIKEA